MRVNLLTLLATVGSTALVATAWMVLAARLGLDPGVSAIALGVLTPFMVLGFLAFWLRRRL